MGATTSTSAPGSSPSAAAPGSSFVGIEGGSMSTTTAGSGAGERLFLGYSPSGDNTGLCITGGITGGITDAFRAVTNAASVVANAASAVLDDSEVTTDPPRDQSPPIKDSVPINRTVDPIVADSIRAAVLGGGDPEAGGVSPSAKYEDSISYDDNGSLDSDNVSRDSGDRSTNSLADEVEKLTCHDVASQTMTPGTTVSIATVIGGGGRRCPICFDTIVVPYVTACGHTVDILCLKSVADPTDLQQTIRCPVCSTQLSSDLLMAAKSASTVDLPTKSWVYYGPPGSDRYWCFDPQTNHTIDEAFRIGVRELVVTISQRVYVIDFDNMVQRCLSNPSAVVRKIQYMDPIDYKCRGIAGVERS